MTVPVRGKGGSNTIVPANISVVPSPQLIVPAKSVGPASVLRSVKVALSAVAVMPATPPLSVVVPENRSTSETVAVPVSVVVAPSGAVHSIKSRHVRCSKFAAYSITSSASC